MHPSNFKLTVEAEDFEDFDRAMRIAFEESTTATHYSIKDGALTLYWHGDARDNLADEGVQHEVRELPYEMDVETAIPFAWVWLKKTRPAGKCPDIDGSVEAIGFRIESSQDGWAYIIVTITKVWSLYHK